MQHLHSLSPSWPGLVPGSLKLRTIGLFLWLDRSLLSAVSLSFGHGRGYAPLTANLRLTSIDPEERKVHCIEYTNVW
jgi:hypothetical protein